MFYLAIKENGHVVAHVPIAGSRARIGRDRDNDVVILRAQISSHHLEISAGPGGFEVQDLKSTNGTWINQTRVRAPLHLGPEDRIRIPQLTIEAAWAPFPYALGFFNQLDRQSPELQERTTSEVEPPSAEQVAEARKKATWPPPRGGG